jgi:prefoldin beta subunit
VTAKSRRPAPLHTTTPQHAPTRGRAPQELARLDDSATVYKLIGPAMVKQDLVEANANVAKRLEYITGEVGRLTGRLADLEAKSAETQQQVRLVCQACLCVLCVWGRGGGGVMLCDHPSGLYA